MPLLFAFALGIDFHIHELCNLQCFVTVSGARYGGVKCTGNNIKAVQLFSVFNALQVVKNLDLEI